MYLGQQQHKPGGPGWGCQSEPGLQAPLRVRCRLSSCVGLRSVTSHEAQVQPPELNLCRPAGQLLSMQQLLQKCSQLQDTEAIAPQCLGQ